MMIRSKKAKEYIAKHRNIAYSSEVDLLSDTLNTSEAEEAVALAEAEVLEKLNRWIRTLCVLRAKAATGANATAANMANDLMREMKEWVE